jgi:malonyl CoA-acyl carrier protein transacylase
MAKFKDALKNTAIEMPTRHIVYSNVTGKASIKISLNIIGVVIKLHNILTLNNMHQIQPYTSVDEIRTLLPLQMIKPVQWHTTIRRIYFDEDCKRFLECSATGILTTMVKLILGDIGQNELEFLLVDI